MHPSCKQNINSTECQKWMSEVLAHCNRLLADKQLQFWDDWWLNEHPVAYYHLPHLKSAYDCQKLKKEIAQQLSGAASLNAGANQMEEDKLEPAWQTALILIVASLALIIIVSMVWLLNSTLRQIAAPRFRDFENERLCRKKCHGASPRSFISFGRPFRPLTRYGPYRSRSIVVPRATCSAFKR
ncbi:hypothetical protein ACLKA6_014567 [Drosophila palustris]